MLIKLVGSALLVAGGGCLGVYYGMEPRLISRELGEIKKGLMIMYSETEYGHTCLEPMCIRAGKSVGGTIGELFENFALGLKERAGESTQEIWEDCVRSCKETHLNDSDLSAVSGLGSYLGCGDIKRQLTGIEGLIGYIDCRTGELREECAKRMRMCRSTGILTGLFVAILLF